ncbi:hypothetical protein [Holdemania massiliensis]|uniref:Uncharacterized protein n=2 Tax=Bacteria TaxID=2 RepID=A0A641XZZ5_BACOV|nr:hypothetical protein [Holdemania massiliensis]KAA4397667.1 hypothetical protein F3C73_26415 [Bacteroides ovatus]MSA69833.1 hypothetical protein [Holdemania massiliensis]MSA88699.1 hypothetical protein [Holdemania massiliensis]MSB77320.1 hypothetical protein [Holdemania massiliensis]MSC32246.1 hypothetical protein [Holdemania massiliensis]
MLTKPVYGWSDFQLEGTGVYGLSYLDDIAFEWVEQAIHGLETMRPFCVKGFLEPNRFLCTVSYWNCHLVCEDDERYPLNQEELIHEFSHTSMLQFCQYLYEDVSQNINEWASFVDYEDLDIDKRKAELAQKLECLKNLIAERTEWFGEHRCFL